MIPDTRYTPDTIFLLSAVLECLTGPIGGHSDAVCAAPWLLPPVTAAGVQSAGRAAHDILSPSGAVNGVLLNRLPAAVANR